jgi:hypothetical protein
MKVISGRNVNELFQIATMSFRSPESLLAQDSRNGEVLSFPTPVTSVYKYPDERVLFSPERNCNPFFHFIEGLWMIEGRDDLGTLTMFAKKMADFSDDGEHVNGAYGYRWREWFGRDQLSKVIDLLKQNPLDRRIVLQMWDPFRDLGSDSKDVPCNTQVYFRCVNDALDMTVTNRSNDMIWGMYGANAVHFSMVQEYVASMVGMKIGKYYQVSNNAHIYKEVWDPLDLKLPKGIIGCFYETSVVKPSPLVDNPDRFDIEMALFFEWLHEGDHFGFEYKNSVFNKTAMPMVEAWWLYKEGLLSEAIDMAKTIKATDWRKVCVEWLERKR